MLTPAIATVFALAGTADHIKEGGEALPLARVQMLEIEVEVGEPVPGEYDIAPAGRPVSDWSIVIDAPDGLTIITAAASYWMPTPDDCMIGVQLDLCDGGTVKVDAYDWLSLQTGDMPICMGPGLVLSVNFTNCITGGDHRGWQSGRYCPICDEDPGISICRPDDVEWMCVNDGSHDGRPCD